jgi:hypothetical protein
MGFFYVPRFQRPYSWDDQQIEEFWQDTIVDEGEAEYFIGSLVLYKEGASKYFIVDGQQRLTTITMILCGIRDALQSEGFDDLANGTQQMIERIDIDNHKQAVLCSETTIPYFQAAIQKLAGTLHQEPATVEEGRIAQAYKLIGLKLIGVVESVRSDTTLSRRAADTTLQAKLVKVRERVLSLKAVVMTLQNDIDAYMIFETLNTRGKDLELSDLVRTHLTRLMPAKNGTTDQVRSRFDDLRKRFEQRSRELDSFVLHFWLSRYEFTAKRNIYKQLRKDVKKEHAKKFFEAFLSDGDLYLKIVAPNRDEWKKEEFPLVASLEAIQSFRVEQPTPFVLAVIRAYKHGTIKLKAAKRAIRSVENFHFAFSAVTSSRSSGGVSQMYARHAAAISQADKQDIAIKEIDELLAKLKSRRPSKDEFTVSFREIVASELYPRQKKLAAYILDQICEHEGQIITDRPRMTIEHLAGQGSKNSPLSHEVIAELGNLTRVSEKVQTMLGTKTVEAKVKILDRQKCWVDDTLREGAKTWGPAEIRRRTDHLAELSFDRVWSL